jgi:flagellar biosynthesis protein FlhG
MESNLMVRIKERQYGPLSKPELRTLVRKGKFSLNDYVWMDDEETWVKAENLKQIEKLFDTDKTNGADRKVIAIGSGKGGVGKTVLSASLGIGLAAMGRDVILVDADFGGANLHTCMGIVDPQYTFLDYYTMNRETLEDIVLDSPIENLKIISGACGTLGMANPKYFQKLRLIKELRKLPADDIIIDLGAGTTYNVIDFFLSVDEKIVVTTPEPTAIQEAYDFIKLSLLRKIQRTFKNEPDILAILQIDGYSNLLQFNSPVEEMLAKAKKSSSEIVARIEDVLSEFKPKLILNIVMDPDEIKEGMAIKTAVAELLSVDLEYAGYVEYDENMRKAIKELKPFILQNPNSPAAKSISKIITLKLLNKNRADAFFKKWQMRKKISAHAKNYPTHISKESETICSVKCFYWDDCEFQNGGLPCRIRHLEPDVK